MRFTIYKNPFFRPMTTAFGVPEPRVDRHGGKADPGCVWREL